MRKGVRMVNLLRAIGACAAMTGVLLACGGKTSGEGSETPATPRPDAGNACVQLDVSSYDVSCTVDSDCVSVGAAICADGCETCRGRDGSQSMGFPDMAIRKEALARYDADTAVRKRAACQVVADTQCTGFAPACVRHQCVVGAGG